MSPCAYLPIPTAVSAPFWTAAATLPVSCPTGKRPGAGGARAVGDVVEVQIEKSMEGFASGWQHATIVAVHRRRGAEEEAGGPAAAAAAETGGGDEDDGVIVRGVPGGPCAFLYDVELPQLGLLRYTLDVPQEPALESVLLAEARKQPFLRGTRVTAQFKRRRIGGVVLSYDATATTYALIFSDGDVRPSFAAKYVSLPAVHRSGERRASVEPSVLNLDDESEIDPYASQASLLSLPLHFTRILLTI